MSPIFVTLIAILSLGSVELDVPVRSDVELTMGGCLGIQGFLGAQQFLEVHKHRYPGYKIAGWRCRFGNKPDPMPDPMPEGI